MCLRHGRQRPGTGSPAESAAVEHQDADTTLVLIAGDLEYRAQPEFAPARQPVHPLCASPAECDERDRQGRKETAETPPISKVSTQLRRDRVARPGT